MKKRRSGSSGTPDFLTGAVGDSGQPKMESNNAPAEVSSSPNDGSGFLENESWLGLPQSPPPRATNSSATPPTDDASPPRAEWPNGR